MSKRRNGSHRPLRFARDEQGAVSVEYTVILAVVAVVCALAVVAIGAPLVRMFLLQKTWLLLPFP